MTITIRTELLAAVARWAGEDENRPALRMVLFTRDEFVACDGHRLARVPLEYDGDPFGVYRVHILAAAAAQRGLDQRDIVIELARQSIHLGIATDVRLVVPVCDASVFPVYDQVMPRGPRPSTAPDGYGFDPKYLAEIYEVQKAAGAADGYHGVRVTGWSVDGLGAMLFEGYRGIRYVIMPVRV